MLPDNALESEFHLPAEGGDTIRAQAAPVKGKTGGFALSVSTKLPVQSPVVGRRQAGDCLFIQMNEVGRPVGIHAFGAVAPPDFGRWVEFEQRQKVLAPAAADNDQSGGTGFDDGAQPFSNTGVGDGFVTLFAKGRQRAVVIEQQQPPLRPAQGPEERVEVLLAVELSHGMQINLQ